MVAKYELIEQTLQNEKFCLTIIEMCALCGVARSGYYAWKSNVDARKQRETRDYEDFQLILDAYHYRGYDKGIRGIYMRLLRMGIRMNRKKIQRLMRKYGLHCPIRKANPYRRMMKSMQTNAVADNHVKREFRLHGPRKILLTDITYIPYDNRFCYLSVIKDAYTAQVLSYVLSNSLEVSFVLQTVNQLIEKHADTLDSEVMIHSDQGSHYTSTSFRTLISNYNIRQSMSRRGNCWDNAPQESFFGHMKSELKDKIKTWDSYEQVEYDIDDWMDYYNNERCQWNLNKLPPNEFYEQTMINIKKQVKE